MTGVDGNLKSNNLNIILIDSNSLEILDKCKSYNYSKIISFDYDSHKFLLEKGIQHTTSDEYLSEDMNNQIQSSAYSLTKWYYEKEVKAQLEYDGINFGRLFHDEIMYDLLKLLKKFYEIRKIVNVFLNSKFHAAGILYDIVSIFTAQTMKTEIKNKTHIFGTERIRINFGIGNKYFVIYVSRSSYLKLKKLVDSITPSFFRITPNNKKNMMLVDFHTTRYKDFFLRSKEFPVNLLLYNRRRPPIWNLESLSILKRVKCSIIPYASSDYNLKNTESEIMTVSQKIDKIWLNDNFFHGFFSIDKISIWHIIKPILKTLFERRINEAISEILKSREIFEKYRLDSVLVLSEIGFIEQIVVKEAKKADVPVFLMQEGFHWDTKEANEMNKSQGVYPINADVFLAWSKLDERDAIENGGISPHKIKTIGTCRYDSLVGEKGTREDYVLLATVGPQPEDIHGLLTQNITDYEKNIIEVCKIVKKLNKKLVVKMHPSPDELNVTNLIKQINPDFTVITSGDLPTLIQNCSVMIVLHLSTAIIEAQILQKPVICMPSIDYKWGTPEIFRSESCLVSTISDLENNLKNILYDLKFRNELIERGKNFIDKNFVNIGKASKEIFQFILKYKS